MLLCCVCIFSLCQESPNMILGDKPLIYEVVLSQYTDAKVTFILICWQKSLNIALLMYFKLSTVICRGMTQWQMMFCQNNFLIVAELTLVRGFALIHFMKYSTATMVKV
jgi:hypothetical protein